MVKQILLLALMGLGSCQEDARPKKVVVQIDEEQLAEAIVKSLVNGAARFSELSPDITDDVVAELPEVAELIEVESEKGGQRIILKLDEEKLENAIYEGMILGSQDAVEIIKTDPPVEPPVVERDLRIMTDIVLEIGSERRLYGELDGERILLVDDLSGDDLSMARKWLRKSTSSTPKKWRLHIRLTKDSNFGQTRKLIKLASGEGISEVIFSFPEE